MQNIIEIKNLRRSFSGAEVVKGITFEVHKGSFFAFLGQNGAGKTTTINMLIGLLEPDGGEILYDGSRDFSAFKNKIGVVFQNNILDDLLTVEENLLTYGALYLDSAKDVKQRYREVSELLSLEGVAKQRFKTLSGGQKRKAEIARALFANPELLFLDEPTTGLDPKTRADVWSIIGKLKSDKNLTIFLTTHYMEETADADYICIINKGEMIASGTPAELKSNFSNDRLLITPMNPEIFPEQLKVLGKKSKKVADTFVIEINDVGQSIDILVNLRDNIRFYEVVKGKMDDVFLNAVGEAMSNE